MAAEVRIRLRITGRVQGVGFRWFVREQARGLYLAGWVRNEADGSVLLEVEGDADAVAQLRSLAARGPDGALVDAVHEASAGREPLQRPFAVAR